jgi:hypothetical protein
VKRGYMKAAKDRGLRFELTDEQFKTLTTSNCHYCKRGPLTVAGTGQGRFVYNGVDRVVNSIGYILENCVPCCFQCNRAKGTLSMTEFLSWVAAVYDASICASDFAAIPLLAEKSATTS